MAVARQFVYLAVPVSLRLVFIVQSFERCKAMALPWVSLLLYSITSISPCSGQLSGPVNHRAGHVTHPHGVWRFLSFYRMTVSVYVSLCLLITIGLTTRQGIILGTTTISVILRLRCGKTPLAETLSDWRRLENLVKSVVRIKGP